MFLWFSTGFSLILGFSRVLWVSHVQGFSVGFPMVFFLMFELCPVLFDCFASAEHGFNLPGGFVVASPKKEAKGPAKP